MCFAGLLMTFAENKKARKREGPVVGSSPHPQDLGSHGVGRDVRAGTSLDPLALLLWGGGLGGHPGPVQPRSPSAAAVLGERFTHLGVVSSSWAHANILCLSPLPRPKGTVRFKSPCPKFPTSLCGRKKEAPPSTPSCSRI